MQAQVIHAQKAALHAQQIAMDANDKLCIVLRDQLAKGHIPLEVEHFLNPEQRSIVMRAIMDERRRNINFAYQVSGHELQIQRDREERERLGQYLGRAIADRLADFYAGKAEGTSRGQGSA